MREMKDTEICWCKNIPSDWSLMRVKDLARLQSGDTFTADDLVEEGLYPVYGGNGLRGYADRYTNDGDHVLIGRQGALCGNINYGTGKFFATEHAIVVYSKKGINVRWLGETLRTANLNRLSMTAAQPGLSVSVINNQFIPCPLEEEQRRIAEYLDSHVSSIDKRVSLLETKRDHYLRLKTAIINRAVTQGLNPDVKMKDSGVEWIGMIPEHWDWHRLKDLGNLYGGLTGKSGDDFRAEDEEGTKPFIPFTNILNNARIDFSQFKSVVMADDEKGQNKVKNQDILFLMSSEDYESIAKTSVVDGDPGEVYLNSFCRGFRMHSKISFAPFVNYQLASEKFRDALRFEARGFTRINIKIDRIASMFVCLPSMEEQVSIVAYLDDKLSAIDKNIEIINQQIEKHKLLKRALINEVITGQRAV